MKPIRDRPIFWEPGVKQQTEARYVENIGRREWRTFIYAMDETKSLLNLKKAEYY